MNQAGQKKLQLQDKAPSRKKPETCGVAIAVCAATKALCQLTGTVALKYDVVVEASGAVTNRAVPERKLVNL
jgi:hypothetical protein